MALATSFAVLPLVGLFALIATAAGHRILRLGRLEFPSDSEHLLCSTALGVVCLQVFLFATQMVGHIRAAVIVVQVLFVLFGLPDVLTSIARAYGLMWRAMRWSRAEKWAIAACLLVLMVEGLAAMARCRAPTRCTIILRHRYSRCATVSILTFSFYIVFPRDKRTR